MLETNYCSDLYEAIQLSKSLNMKNICWETIEYKYQNKSEALEILNLVNGELFDFMEANFSHYPYWGNSCLNLSVAAFCFLKMKGYDAELIYGNVNVNNSPEDEFNATRESLKHEFLNKINDGEQDIHAWVGLGGNIILDFAIMPRLVKLYKYPKDFGDVVLGPSDYLEKNYRLKYKPILVGSDFFKVTNKFDPLDMLEHLKKNSALYSC